MRAAVVPKHLTRCLVRFGKTALEPLVVFACRWTAALEIVVLHHRQHSALSVGRHCTSNPSCKRQSLAAGVGLAGS